MRTSRYMSSIRKLFGLLSLTIVAARSVGAQGGAPPNAPPTTGSSAVTASPAPPLPGPPVRRIESAQAISKEALGTITTIRHLSDGRVLLNDAVRRRLLMLDSTLTRVTVVLDSLTEVQNAYGTRAGAMFAYRGDSTVFIDVATLAMLFLDETGKITRVRAVPRAQDMNGISSTSAGAAGFDVKGRFIYRIAAATAPPAVAPPPGMPYFPSPPDSAFVVAVNLDTRKSDTLGIVRIPKQLYSVRMDQEFGFSINMVPNPLPLTDDWALLADGSVAFVRGIDYRVDFRAPDGTLTSSEKLPFPWVRMTDDDKNRFADSAKAAQIKNAQTDFATQMVAWSNLLNKPYPASFTPPEGYVPPPGLPKDWILPKGVSFPATYIPACPPNAPAPTPTAAGPPTCTQTYFSEMYGTGYTPPAPTYRAPTLVRPRDLPDYKPPVGTSAVRADADGNLWVRTIQMRPNPGGQIFDVINRAGELFDRIQLPTGYQLVGFGPGKLVYLSNRDASGLHLSRVRLK